MDPDLKMYLRTNERPATIVAAKMCTTLAGGDVFCIAFDVNDDGIMRLDPLPFLGDHFNVPSAQLSGDNKEQHRWESLNRATRTAEYPPSQPLVGKQVIIVLDERGNPESYRPPLAHQNSGGGADPAGRSVTASDSPDGPWGVRVAAVA